MHSRWIPFPLATPFQQTFAPFFDNFAFSDLTLQMAILKVTLT